MVSQIKKAQDTGQVTTHKYITNNAVNIFVDSKSWKHNCDQVTYKSQAATLKKLTRVEKVPPRIMMVVITA